MTISRETTDQKGMKNMFEPQTLNRIQAALSVGQQVAAAAQGNGTKLERAVEAKLVTDVARLVLEEDERQKHRLIVPKGLGL